MAGDRPAALALALEKLPPRRRRLLRLLLQVGKPGEDGSQALLPAATAARVKSFWKGLLAHLIIVPSWVLSPVALLAGLVAACGPLGALGAASVLGVAGGLAVSKKGGPLRPLLCAAVALMAAKAPKGRGRALAGAGVVSLLTWCCSAGEFAQRPSLIGFITRWAADYYAQAELRLAKGTVLRREKSFFAFHPHGCLSAGWTINGTFNPEFMRRAGRVNWLIDPNLRHKNPSFKMLCGAYASEDRAIAAGDAPGFRELMGKGESVAFIPGGFQDAVAFAYRKERTVIRRRKAFIKFCLQHGYRLHPVYTFGESETYYTFTGLEGLRNWLSLFNIPMVVFVGWLPVPFLPRPDAKILTYVGRGIDLPHLPDPTKEEVDHWHGTYISALTQLFEESKAEAGHAQAQLEIL